MFTPKAKFFRRRALSSLKTPQNIRLSTPTAWLKIINQHRAVKLRANSIVGTLFETSTWILSRFKNLGTYTKSNSGSKPKFQTGLRRETFQCMSMICQSKFFKKCFGLATLNVRSPSVPWCDLHRNQQRLQNMALFRLLGSLKSHGQIDYHSDFTWCPLSQPQHWNGTLFWRIDASTPNYVLAP